MSTVDDALAEDLITVEIVGLPVDVQLEAQQQNDELTRELVLVAEQLRQEGDSAALPVRFVELVGTLSTRYSMFTAEQEQQLRTAIESGAERLDMTYRVPRSAPRRPPTWATSWTRSTTTAGGASCCSRWRPRRSWSPTGAGSWTSS